MTASFNDVAVLYDEARPGYPESIVDDIVAFAAFGDDPHVLEVGCGTGKMTLPFARRGYRIVALDPGERLAALAAEHCRPYPQTRFVVGSFETWQHAPASFDLLLSAQAFHWVDPAYRLVRAAELLRAGGAIALIWTLDRSQGSAFWKATESIYERYNPQSSSGHLTQEAGVDWVRNELRSCQLFVEPGEVRHSWALRYTGEAYLKLLRTFSDHWAMPERFFEEIAGVVASMGGEVVRDYETIALLARKGQHKPMGVAA